MDNKKIGNLIATLRKKQGLTQQELGDKVGVGFRAVSKWERGINCPDIGIINNLSKILGISSDELLSGKLKENKDTNNKKKIPTKIIITISLVFSIILITTSLYIYFHNQTYVYEMISDNKNEYYVEGQVTFQGNKLSIIVNEIGFLDNDFDTTNIKNYEYRVMYKETYLFGYGYTPNAINIEEKTIQNTIDEFRINYISETELKRKDILKNGMYIIFEFIDSDNNKIIKKIDFSFIPIKENEETG